MDCKKSCEKWNKWLYLLSRVLVGLMFILHGWSKLAGGFQANLMGVAGIVEVLVGAGLLLGFFTRLAATAGAVTMLVAYFKVHAMQGLNPLNNGGELALAYLFVFFWFMKDGAGMWSLEKQLLKKEKF